MTNIIRIKDKLEARRNKPRRVKPYDPVQATKQEPEKPTHNVKGYVDPDQLHSVLDTIQCLVMTFRNDKELKHYRSKLYQINSGGIFRFRTVRDERSEYGIIVWRML